MNKTLKKLLTVIITLVLLGLIFIPVPYYITKPGTTEKLAPLISVAGKYAEKTGSFSLTTIGLQHATPVTLLIASLMKYQEIDKASELRAEGETDAQFNVRQMYYMNSAKNNAIEAAFKQAGLKAQAKYNGVFVLSLVDQSDAKKLLAAGDTIHAIDGKQFKSSDEFITYVGSRKKGSSVSLTYTKAGETTQRSGQVKLIDIDEKGKVGIGITLVDDKEIKTTPKVTVHTEKIGGPSAGFMFSLEIYSSLAAEDLTRGYDIAGTGTIEADGTIGRIGGIEEKIVTAAKAGKDYFLAPDDEITSDMKKADSSVRSNYDDAIKVAKAIDTSMIIIPVKSLSDAIVTLQKLPIKK